MITVLEEEVEPVAKRPPTEIERQERAIAALGDDYMFPLFNGRQAIESQRKSGYKNTSRAAREIIDNAYEAGAKNIWVAFRRAGDGGRVMGEYKEAVTAIAFIDDGPGMLPNMARYALSWGGGSHFENPTGIGRFGFGLPNSSINQTRRVEVYTRTDPNTGWVRAVLDITPETLATIPPSGLVKVEDPEEDVTLPPFVVQHLNRFNVELKTGTVVVWEKPDRLQAKLAPKLKEYMLDDFGGHVQVHPDCDEVDVDAGPAIFKEYARTRAMTFFALADGRTDKKAVFNPASYLGGQLNCTAVRSMTFPSRSTSHQCQ